MRIGKCLICFTEMFRKINLLYHHRSNKLEEYIVYCPKCEKEYYYQEVD